MTGHDHFFGAFTKFGGTDPSHTGEWLDEVAGRAASQNTQYLELMATPTWNRLNTITKDMSYGATIWQRSAQSCSPRAGRRRSGRARVLGQGRGHTPRTRPLRRAG